MSGCDSADCVCRDGAAVAHLFCILRPDDDGRWYVQNDVDHLAIGVSLYVEQAADYLRIFFDRTYSHAVGITITSDDDFRNLVAGHGNLGLNNSTIRIVAGGRVIDPANVYRDSGVKPGGGNLWISIAMADK